MRSSECCSCNRKAPQSSRRNLTLFRVTIILILATLSQPAESFANSNSNPMKVLVTGANGQTGRLVLKKLEADPRFEPKALVRTEKGAKSLIKSVPMEHMIVSDITSETFEEDLPNRLLKNMDAMIICTSAVPRVSRRSLAKAVLMAPWNLVQRKRAIDFRNLRFKWKNNGYPELVDYYGQRKQINLAKKLGMKHVVLISSMGVTDRSHFLNRVGKNEDGSGNGDILVWKRKAERYLVESGLDYTILHPGGLVDTPGGVQDLVLDVDDNLFFKHRRTCISREDVADLCVTSLTLGQGKRVSLDCITQDVEPGEVRKSTEECLSSFLEGSRTAHYQ
eukprot:scaffold6898_cov123-Cylindrotheca_fusiformis.AAC.11